MSYSVSVLGVFSPRVGLAHSAHTSQYTEPCARGPGAPTPHAATADATATTADGPPTPGPGHTSIENFWTFRFLRFEYMRCIHSVRVR